MQIAWIAYDPWQALDLATRLTAQGAPMVEIRPTVQNFSASMLELEALVRQGTIHHDGNAMMAWMMSNVVCHRDAKDNVYPRKPHPAFKIDGPVALLMAHRATMLTAARGEPMISVL